MTDMWECECGKIEYGKHPPEECEKCWTLNNFVKVPEDLVEEKKEADLGQKIRMSIEEDENED